MSSLLVVERVADADAHLRFCVFPVSFVRHGKLPISQSMGDTTADIGLLPEMANELVRVLFLRLFHGCQKGFQTPRQLLQDAQAIISLNALRAGHQLSAAQLLRVAQLARDIERAVSSIDMEDTGSRALRDQLLAQITVHAAACAPVRRMPVELLTATFNHMTEGMDVFDIALALEQGVSRVSRVWRCAADGVIAAWTHVRVKAPRPPALWHLDFHDVFRQQIRRHRACAPGLPLHLAADLNEPLLFFGLRHLFPMMGETAHAWETLTIAMEGTNASFQADTHLPNVVAATVDCRHIRRSTAFLFLSCMPNLRTLAIEVSGSHNLTFWSLHRSNPDPVNLMLPDLLSLSKLSLSSHPATCILSEPLRATLAKYAATLEHLSLLCLGDVSLPAHLPPVTLQRLHTLCLQGAACECLSKLSLPALRDLNMVDGDLTRVRSHPTHALPHLVELALVRMKLDVDGMITQDVAQLFDLTSNVTHLMVSDDAKRQPDRCEMNMRGILSQLTQTKPPGEGGGQVSLPNLQTFICFTEGDVLHGDCGAAFAGLFRVRGGISVVTDMDIAGLDGAMYRKVINSAGVVREGRDAA
ncbi:hypothetical protein BD626DRAFT_572386 [Schizophyllum amplum]|uniref:F-box domain-containing protein n=1 Tax=Schizophyllum amplum TaxID=97359 RepID=A0A550C4J5_9AGAR|nr:hypothetical protein BD626DRAFT_572386 [Auriculariopsis ampla]